MIPLLFALALCSRMSFALRTLILPPIRVHTVHSGQVAPARMCATGDYYPSYAGQPPIIASPDSGVRVGYQTIFLDFVNISSIDQSLTVEVLPGTETQGKHSDGGVYGAPASIVPPGTGTTPSAQVTSITSPVNLHLGASGSSTDHSRYLISFICAATGCYIQDLANTRAGTYYTTTDASLPPQNCLALNSVAMLKIKIAEDRGAILGNISTIAHRVEGTKDHFIAPPPDYPLNGGRPF